MKRTILTVIALAALSITAVQAGANARVAGYRDTDTLPTNYSDQRVHGGRRQWRRPFATADRNAQSAQGPDIAGP
jgi:hypothetical protein